MANKNDLLRRITIRSPQIVERVITLWGSPGLGVYINDLLSGTKGGAVPELSADIKAALSALNWLSMTQSSPSTALNRRPWIQACLRKMSNSNL